MNSRKLNSRIDRWLATRQWRLLWFAGPVLLALGLLALVAIVLVVHPANSYSQRYTYLARGLLNARLYEEARVACLRGLADSQDERESAQWLYYLAAALNGLGNQQQAQALIRAAAPLDRPGCLQAHLLIARNLLEDTNLTTRAILEAAANPTNAVAVELRLAERHLLCALALEPDSTEVSEALGRFYINTRQLAKARVYLLKVFPVKPDTALLLSICADLENDGPSTIQWSDRAISAFEQKLLKSAPHYLPSDRQGILQAMLLKTKYLSPQDIAGRPRIVITNAVPQDSPQIWLGIVQLLLLNGKYEAAMTTLDQQMLVNSNALFAAAIGDLCATWAQTIRPTDPGVDAARLRLVEKGLKNDPDNLSLQLLLVQVSHGDDDPGREAQAALHEAVAAATGERAAMWEFILWTDARVRGDLVTARRHLQTAARLSPDNPRIENDVALDLSGGSHADAERGLAIIQRVLDKYPASATFRETRGEIFAALGRNQDAVADLEYASAQVGSSPETSRTLAKVYAALGRVPTQALPDELVEAHDLVRDNKYKQAYDLLEKASRTSPNPAFAAAIADVCASWADSLPLGQGAQRLQLIQSGLNQDPENHALQALLLQAAHVPGESGRSAQKLLDQIVMNAVGEPAAQWHLFLGRDARKNGDLPGARRHLQTAYELSPKNAEIQLELATILADGSPADLAQALQLIQPVVDQFPDNPGFLLTHGKIMARLGRNQEALSDLTFAAPRLADPREAHRQLAGVYDALGNAKAAAEQRRLAGSP
jgi:predicted Zn-dependent protease